MDLSTKICFTGAMFTILSVVVVNFSEHVSSEVPTWFKCVVICIFFLSFSALIVGALMSIWTTA